MAQEGSRSSDDQAAMSPAIQATPSSIPLHDLLSLGDNHATSPETPRAMRPRVRSVGNRSVRQYGSGSQRFSRAGSGARSPSHLATENRPKPGIFPDLVETDSSSDTITEATSMAVEHDGEDEELPLVDSDDSMEVGPCRDDDDFSFMDKFATSRDTGEQDSIGGRTPKLTAMRSDGDSEQFASKDTPLSAVTGEPFNPDFSRDMLGALPRSRGKFPTSHNANDRKHGPSSATTTHPSSRVKDAGITKDRNLTGPRWSGKTYTEEDIDVLEQVTQTTHTEQDVDDVLERVRKNRLRRNEHLRQKKLHKKTKSALKLDRLKSVADWIPMAGEATEEMNAGDVDRLSGEDLEWSQ